ncbi:MAG: hypothetical protein ABIL39_02635 [candidate division WOR-3 bacterium]
MGNKSALAKKIIFQSMMLLFILISVQFRIRLSTNPEYYDPKDPTAFYWTENALQYHYAELVGNGKPIPSFDPKLQAPAGVKIFENLTILMEYPCGWLYRILGLKSKGVLFHTWAITFIAIWASLGILAVYLLARALGLSPLSSLFAGLLQNFSLAAVGRSTFGFLNEDFALPFIIAGIAGYLYALHHKKNRIIAVLGAGICLLISLSAWHFARFIFLTIIVISVFNLWLFEIDKQTKEKAYILLFLLFVPFLGSFLVPVLKSRLYFLSPPFALGFGSIIGILLFSTPTGRPPISSLKGWFAILTGLGFLVLSLILTNLFKTETEYLHVWSLLLAKIKYLGIKPNNPEMLDYAARSLWIEAFNSPHPVSIFKNLFPIIIPAILALRYVVMRSFVDTSIRLFFFFSMIFFVSYLAIERMGVVNNYFISIWAVMPVLMEAKTKRQLREYLIYIGLGIIFLFNFYQAFHIHQPTDYIKTLRRIFGNEIGHGFFNWRLNNVELVRFIRLQTPADAIFLSSFGVGPLIFTYAERAIVLQPKFEVRNCQNLVREFLAAIYGSEEEFYNFCRSKRVDYFLYDIRILLDNTREGSRWIAGKTEISTSTAAFLCHFAPEDLKHFQLIYQNTYYRLYKVLKEGETKVPPKFSYQLIYDLRAFGNQTKECIFFDDRHTSQILMRIKNAKILLQEANAILIHNPQRACQLTAQSIALYPGLIGLATIHGIALTLSGQHKEGLAWCEQEVAENPLFPLAHYNLAYCRYLNNDREGAISALKETLRLDPNFSPALEMLKQLQD